MTTFTTEDREDAEKMNNGIVMDKDGCVSVGDFKPRDAIKRIEQLEAELAEMQRLFNKAMDEWEKDRNK